MASFAAVPRVHNPGRTLADPPHLALLMAAGSAPVGAREVGGPGGLPIS